MIYNTKLDSMNSTTLHINEFHSKFKISEIKIVFKSHPS